jgi:hypothetical protein
MIQTLVPNNDAVFQDDNAPIHTCWNCSVIVEPLWSVLKTRLRDRFPPPTFLKQLEDVLQAEWCKIPIETV